MTGAPESSTTPVVEVEGLSHSYGERQALQNVSFGVGRGEIFGLLGPNGGGKTTAFRILSTLLRPSGGGARILGFDVLRDPLEVRRRIGVVFQAPSLDKKLTAYENLMHQGHLYGLSGALLKERIGQALARVKLTERAGEYVEKYSGGMRRRVELAKGLLHRPKLLLLDEPSTGLDPGARKDLWDYLRELSREGVTCLLTTHYMDEAAQCHRLCILNQGGVVALDTPEKLCAAIGGDIITIRTSEPDKLREEIAARFEVGAKVVDGSVRVEREKGHELAVQLAQAFGARMNALTVSRPALEDVFIQRTGHRFWAEGGEKH